MAVLARPEPDALELMSETPIDLGRVVHRLMTLPEWPWFHGGDESNDCPDHKGSGLALVDTGRSEDWPIARLCEWPTAAFIASAPVLVARLAVERIELAIDIHLAVHSPSEQSDPDIQAVCYDLGLQDNDVDPEEYMELKRRLSTLP